MPKNDEFNELSVSSVPDSTGDVARFDETDANASDITALESSKADRQGDTLGDETPLGAVHTEQASVTGGTGITINVPTDVPTLDGAITAALEYIPNRDAQITINIESGHSLTEQVHITSRDASHITIESEDAEVPVDGGFDSTQDLIFIDGGGASPKLNVLIDCAGNCYNGIHIKEKSRAMLGGGSSSGIKNASFDNVRVSQSSSFFAYNARLSGAGNNGITVRAAATADLGGTGGGGGGADLSGAGNDGIYLEYASRIRAIKANVTGAGDNAIEVIRASSAAVSECDCSNAGNNGLFAVASVVNMRDGVVNNVPQTAVYSTRGSTVNARGVSIDGQGNSGRGFRADGSRLDCLDGSAINCTVNDIETIRGGTVAANGVSTTNSTGGDPHESDMNIAPNTLESDGIIFADATEV